MVPIGGIKLTPLVTPPVQEYEFAPPPVNVILSPSHMIVAVELAKITGKALTEIFIDSVF